MVLMFLIFLVWTPTAVSAESPSLPGNCSEAYFYCDSLADCVENNVDFTFQCVCQTGSSGDGFKTDGFDGCTPDQAVCATVDDCHVDGVCNGDNICECKPFYRGDGKTKCSDIDECLSSPCDVNANCQNNVGANFTCTCRGGYTGNGLTCIKTCVIKQECHSLADCVGGFCKCNAGYTGGGVTDCTDIDECETGDFNCPPPSSCVNTVGSYKCGCPNGFTGDGVTCTELYPNCEEIRINDPGAVSGRVYEIDPDRTGPLKTMKVTCVFENDVGITIVFPENTALTPIQDATIAYKDARIQDVQGLVNASEFCYQTQRLECRNGYNLFGSVNTMWENANGTAFRSWGGSGVDEMCACGVLGYCENGVTCNCDGTSTKAGIDFGKIIDKSRLPISSVSFHTGTGSASYQISEIKCAPKPIDILRDCDAIKESGVEDNGPQLIDIDEADGPLDPALVHCDMKKYEHVGLTVIPHNKQSPVEPTESGAISYDYVTPSDVIYEIIRTLEFCDQEVRYVCRNAPIHDGADRKIYFTSGNESKIMDYFPGGNGTTNNCGCGITGSCVDKNITCNCDMNDNITRYDIANHTIKADLPIGSVYLDINGTDSYAKVYVGPILCSRQQFGIEPNCEKYRAVGISEPYTYLIDPDGPFDETKTETNYPPFLVECLFNESPPQGVTVIHHDTEEPTFLTAESFSFDVFYKGVAFIEQLQHLRRRSTFCGQSLSFSCNNYKLRLSGGRMVRWTSIDGDTFTYLSGGEEGDTGCACNIDPLLECQNGGLCNCDSGLQTMDIGELGNMTHLPISKLDFSGVNDQLSGINSSLEFTLGPLRCFETFPTCYDLYTYLQAEALIGEAQIESGKYTIDPDRSGGDPPYTVTCDFPFTIVGISGGSYDGPTPGEGICHSIKYLDFNNEPITDSQIDSLVKASHACRQSLSYTCTNAPWTGHVNYTTCDGREQKGWSLSGGHDMCSCGMTGTCVGGAGINCNCDTEDGVQRSDGGFVYNTTRLPVCQVCMSLDGSSPATGSRSNSISVGGIVCTGQDFVGENSCQDRRTSSGEDEVIYLRPNNGNPVLPVYCDMTSYPAIGIMEIRIRESSLVIPANTEFDVNLEYFMHNAEDIHKLIDNSYYCTQEIFLNCNDGALDMIGTNGWYSRDGTAQDSWGGNIGKVVKCELDGSNCNCNKAGNQTDGGILGEKSLLPISRVKLAAHSTERLLTVGPVKCYELKPDCYDIMMSGNRKTAYSNRTYVIDPDGPDGVDPFIVVCFFDARNNNAITEVLVEGSPAQTNTAQVAPYSSSRIYEYRGATSDQINTLTRQAPFCYQGIQYDCTSSPISNSVQYDLYNDFTSPTFGNAYDTNSTVCPCNILGTCEGFDCRCDEKLATAARDNGTITDKDRLPITEVKVGGQTGAGASSTVTVSAVRCEERPQDIPKDCQEARVRGYSTGEVLISPSFSIPPFFVYCDMEVNPGRGTAVLYPEIEPETTVNYDGSPIDIPYKGLSNQQIKALVDHSAFCYQPVKYNCRNTKFLEDGKFTWMSVDGSSNTYFGDGTPSQSDCTCGNENLCGGPGTISLIQQRRCNCGIGDDADRVDSGIMNIKSDLPIRSLTFSATGIANSRGNITIDKLYCGQNPIAFDECALGYHDCHEWADCIDTASGFECVCPAKFRGLGVPYVWANGRDCYDDDECAFNPCDSTAVCYNYPGGFNCTCNKGYIATSPTKCRDINECVEEGYDVNCDVNAKCINTEGSFICKCKRGYKGIGTNGTCERIGICACFGDPHCISFDERWLDFMGECQYVMARDNCGGNNPTFEVWTHHWDMRRTDIQGISWVKDVTVVVNDTRIYLGPDRAIRINGRNFIAYTADGISVTDNGREVSVITSFGLEVYWNGGDEVEVLLEKNYKGKTCGLCGNFNEDDQDDWMIGQRCGDQAGQITTNENIFGNSWAVNEYLVKEPTCDADCNATAPNFSLCDTALLLYYCDRVFNPDISPFKECLAIMDEKLLNNLKSSCIFDLCNVADDIELGMCSSAERLLNECQKNLDVEIDPWRKPGFCELTCTEHMEYRTCGPRGEPDKVRQRTCLNVILDTHPGIDSFCTEGCYCKPGYVLEGKKCVLPNQCGCLLEGVYIGIDESFINFDCTSVRKCNGTSQSSMEPMSCDTNAGCYLNEETGVFGCHCLDGYKGNGLSCQNDNCFNVTCPLNMECYNSTCQCKKGFTGDCNQCEDIDECATKTDDCVHIGQNCSNTIGGYVCNCIKGYVPYGNYCLDVDECEAGFDSCDANAECINTNGGFICKCCEGYDSNGAGGCSANSQPKAPLAGGKCCSCNAPECNEPGQVCGNNGKTYTNQRQMIVEACKTDKFIEVSYKGACRTTCDSVVCERPYEQCSVDTVLNRALCGCRKCGDEGDAVCSNRLVFFPSQCEFERIMCEINDGETYLRNETVHCYKYSQGPVTQWSEWSECSADCGPGEMTRNRTETRTRVGDDLTTYPLSQTAVCYGNCSEAPCFNYTCPGYGKVCVPSTVNSTVADCICPNCTNREDETLCGLVGYRQLTFKNKCELQKKACEANRRPHVLSLTACGTLPLNCSLYTKYQDLSDGDCVGEPVPVGICEGGCGISPDKCCEPDKTEMYAYSLTCANGTALQRQISSVLSCKCNYLANQ